MGDGERLGLMHACSHEKGNARHPVECARHAKAASRLSEEGGPSQGFREGWGWEGLSDSSLYGLIQEGHGRGQQAVFQTTKYSSSGWRCGHITQEQN